MTPLIGNTEHSSLTHALCTRMYWRQACVHMHPRKLSRTHTNTQTKGRQWADRHWGLVWDREEVICLIICSVYSRIQCKKDLHPWIQERLEESGNYSHQGWGEFTSRSFCTLQFICLKKKEKYPFSIKNFIIDKSIDRSVQFWVNWPQPWLTCRQITNAHRHTRTHTLPDLAYKKMCVCEQRKFCRRCGHTRTHARTHTNTPTQQVQCWAKLWRTQPKTTRDTYSITMSDSYSTTWIHCMSTMQHYSILRLLFLSFFF